MHLSIWAWKGVVQVAKNNSQEGQRIGEDKAGKWEDKTKNECMELHLKQEELEIKCNKLEETMIPHAPIVERF